MKKGFTLLEMLVVIGIIGIIMGLSMVSYSTAQKKSRDTRRKSDLKSIQNSLEQYYSICGYKYPPTVAPNSYTHIVCPSPSAAIMPTVPTDPKTNDPYIVTSTDDATYTICVPSIAANQYLETESLSAAYCLSNQQ